MKHTVIVTIAAMALLAVGGSAFAQQAGPRGGGGQFGPGGGQRGPMMRMGMGLNGPQLLKHPNVQKDLGLTEEQKKKIDALMPRGPQGGGFPGGPGGPGFPGGPGGQGGPGGPPPEGGFGGGPGGPPPEGGFGGGAGAPPPPGGFGGGQGRGPQAGQDIEKKIAEILTSKQLTRYKEIQLQATAPMSLLRPEVAEKLGLSEDQRQEIDGIIREGMPMPPRGPGGPGGQGGPGGPPPEGGFGGGPGGPPPQGGFGGGQGGPPPQGGFGGGGQRGPGRPPMMDDAKRQETLKKALAVLTSEQKAKWQAMTGKAIDLTPPKRNED
ncbi:MAG: hypothetical protein JSS65_03035 [Armatimonadetes bacterium]|nr:hypothetical protein [Armatimonadota bacterium]